MVVEIDGSVYEMNKQMYECTKQMISKYLPYGIYCIEKDGIAIFLNKKSPNDKILYGQIAQYKKEGYTVYYNARGKPIGDL